MVLVLACLVAVLAPAPLELPRLLDDVGAHAPAVDAGAARLEVARAGVGVAGAWDDATLSVMSEAIPLPGGGGENPIMIAYQLSQPLDVFGRRRAARRGAAARVDRERAALRRVEWDARAQAAALFFELWMNGEQARILGEQVLVLERMRDSGLARVRAGMAMGHHDVLRAEAELAAMQAERAALVDERAALAAMLNALRGRPLDAMVGEPVLPVRAPLPALDRATAGAAHAPEVDAARAMRAEADAGVVLARRMYWPMVMVDALYQQNLDGMSDGLGFGVTLSVPLAWRQRQDRELAMARAMVRATAREERAMQTMADAELRMAWSRARAAERKLEALERAAIPRMRDTVASAEAAYAAGAGDFLPLLDAVMQLERLELERVEAIARRGIARFELDRIAGAEVVR